MRLDVCRLDASGSIEDSRSTDGFPCIIATHRNFLNAKFEMHCNRISEFHVIVEAAPSVEGPDLDLLLQREAADDTLHCLETVVQFKTQAPAFESIGQQPQIHCPQTKGTSDAVMAAVVDSGSDVVDRDFSSNTRGSCFPGPQSTLSTFQCMTELTQDCKHDIESKVECRQRDDISDDELLDGEGWSAFKFRKREQMARGSTGDVKQLTSTTPRAKAHCQLPVRGLGFKTSSGKKEECSRRKFDVESDGLLSDIDWKFDLEDSDDLEMFDASFSADLASMTEISGLEVDSYGMTREREGIKPFAKQLKYVEEKSEGLLCMERQLDNFSEDQSQRSLRQSNRRETPGVKNPISMQTMRLSPDYSRMKRTSDRSQRLIVLECVFFREIRPEASSEMAKGLNSVPMTVLLGIETDNDRAICARVVSVCTVALDSKI